MSSKARIRSAIVALAIPAVVLAGTPASASDGKTTVGKCWLDRSTGDPALYASLSVKNNDANNQHNYTIDLTFSTDNTSLGSGTTYVNDVAQNGSGKSDAQTPVLYPTGAADVPNGEVTCEWVTKDDNGELVDNGTWIPGGDDGTSNAVTYTVVRGDTLSGIAEEQCGDASRWTEIYNANRDTIEAVARDHGRPDSDDGHWIYPGTDLVITC
ncbi:LysM peptidoglycan-binding domain-containing protein [Streptomyces spinosirectus]